MTETLLATEVFTPSSYPEHTYVERGAAELENALRKSLHIPGDIISLSGPSKSGKTALVARETSTDHLVVVAGGHISSVDDLWNKALDQVGLPDETATSAAVGEESKLGTEGKAGVSVPFLGKGETSITSDKSSSSSSTSEVRRSRRGLTDLADSFSKQKLILLIDDFHYIPDVLRTEIAKAIKEAARLGVKVVVASVPHRADDVVRSNPELRGRVKSIDLTYWDSRDLTRIATLGFKKLNTWVSEQVVAKIVLEAVGSPQLVQAICLDLCFGLNIEKALETFSPAAVTEEAVERALRETATRTDFRTLLKKLHDGPPSRGVERALFDFADGTTGDTYRCVLLALANEPPRLSHTFKSLMDRVALVCIGDKPSTSGIQNALLQIQAISRGAASHSVLEWDGDNSLEVLDPYFLYYLRWGSGLKSLAARIGSNGK